jgi:DNA-directed RNA polymerase subunit RPC12/RpoP
MDRADLSAAIIHEMGAMFMTEVAAVWARVLQDDLAEIERRGQQVSRVVRGRLVERVAAVRGADRPEACPACGGRLWRARHLQGLVGDYRLARATYRCAACGQSHVPLEDASGLGTQSDYSARRPVVAAA